MSEVEARIAVLADQWERQADEAQAAFFEMGYPGAPAISKTLRGHAHALRALVDEAPACADMPRLRQTPTHPGARR